MATFEDLPSTTDDILLDNLSTADIFRFGRTNKGARHTVQSYINRRYKLSRVLSRFFSEDQTEELRTLMSATGMIISGSVALQFLDRTIYPDSDLDLYAPFQYAWHIADWLVSAGYTYTPKKESLPTVDIALRTAASRNAGGHTGITLSTSRGYLKATCVLDFTASHPPRKVQLIFTLRATLELILGFHSTCVMNLITHDKAYCLFPQATLEERRSLTYLYPMSTIEPDQIAYDKYIERGWDLINGITRKDFDDPYSSFARGTRFVGDTKCWTLPIRPLREDLPESNMDINSFALKYDANLEPVFSSRHLDLEGLQQPYVLLDNDANYVMENLALRYVYQAHRIITEETDEDAGDDENRAEELTDEEGYPENLENGSEIKLDHTLKVLVREIRELDANRM